MKRPRWSLVDLASLVLVACALVMTGIALRREFARGAEDPAVRNIVRRADFDLVGQSIGPETAEVAIVLFGDFQCPYCARAQRVTEEVLAATRGRAKFLFRHLPLETIHPHAWEAALAAECASEQDSFRQFHDALFQRQDSIGLLSWVDFALRVGIADTAEFRKCQQTGRHAAALERDVLLARSLGLNGTPAFIVGNELIAGLPPTRWLVDRANKEARRLSKR